MTGMEWGNVKRAGRRSTRTQGTSRGTGDHATRGGKSRKRHSGSEYSVFGKFRPY